MHPIQDAIAPDAMDNEAITKAGTHKELHHQCIPWDMSDSAINTMAR
jgi:hypothetical protein